MAKAVGKVANAELYFSFTPSLSRSLCFSLYLLRCCGRDCGIAARAPGDVGEQRHRPRRGASRGEDRCDIDGSGDAHAAAAAPPRSEGRAPADGEHGFGLSVCLCVPVCDGRGDLESTEREKNTRRKGEGNKPEFSELLVKRDEFFPASSNSNIIFPNSLESSSSSKRRALSFSLCSFLSPGLGSPPPALSRRFLSLCTPNFLFLPLARV